MLEQHRQDFVTTQEKLFRHFFLNFALFATIVLETHTKRSYSNIFIVGTENVS